MHDITSVGRLLFFAFLLALTIAPARAARHMWVWSTTGIIANSSSARADLFSFCAAPHGDAGTSITVLYLYAHTQITDEPVALRSFLSEAHAQGLEVHFLDGDPQWVADEASRIYAENVLATALTFNQGGTPSQRFDGIQYDVEPYLASTWAASESTTWNRFFTLLGNCQTQVDTYNSSSAPSIVFEAAIPRWYDSDANAVTSSSQVQSITDGVVIMDYTDQAALIIADASGELAFADTAGTRVTVGIETADVSPEPATVTFFDETVHVMEQRLAEAEAAFASSPSYRGIGVHHYATYQAQELPVELSAFGVD